MTQTPNAPAGDAGDAGTGADAPQLARLHGPDGARLTEPHMTAEQVATLFNLTPRTVRKYARDGGWPHARTPARGGGVYLFCTHDLDAIAASLAHGRDS